MRSALIDRRQFMKAAGSVYAAGLLPQSMARAAGADAVFAAAYRGRDGVYGVAVLDEAGGVVSQTPLPDRGHDVVLDPAGGRAVAFARQPGTFAVVFDLAGRGEPVVIASAQGRHFFGHGVFSPDGRLLYATENDFERAAGMVGVYDATRGFRRVGEFPTHGTGPHELLLLDDGRTLAVANGGIETHPDFGRAKLNLATMKPSLVFLDREHGALIEKHALPPALHQLSIRHMDRDAGGRVWFGCQYEGPAIERPPLIGHARQGEEIALCALPDEALAGLRNYVGSVAANRRANTVAVTSPEGNSLVILDAGSSRIVARLDLTEVCGVAPDGGSYAATTGEGILTDAAGHERRDPEHLWDNHLRRIG